jgi:hypothetical protein
MASNVPGINLFLCISISVSSRRNYQGFHFLIADFRLPIAPPWRADGHWKELPHHFFNRQSAIGNEKMGVQARP